MIRSATIAFSFLIIGLAAGGAPKVNVNLEEGAVVGDIVTIAAMVTSDAGIVKVEFSVDDQVRATVMKPPFEYKWDTIDDDEGKHTVIVSAYDTDGRAVSKRTRVEVENDFSKGIKYHYDRAFALFRNGDFDRAILAGRKAARINGTDVEAIKALAAGVGGKGDYNRAIALLTDPPRINNQIVGDPKRFPLRDKDALEVRGYCYLKRAAQQPGTAGDKDISLALQVSKQYADMLLAEIRGAHPEPFKTLDDRLAVGDALFTHGDVEEALKTYEAGLDPAKPNTRLKNRIALAMARMKRFSDAEISLSQIVNSGRADSGTHAVLGYVQLLLRRYDRARSEVESGVQAKSIPCLVIAAQADAMQRNFRQSLDEINKAASKVNCAEVHFVMFGLAFDDNDLKRASDALFETLIRLPNFAEGYAQRGLLLAALQPGNGIEQANLYFDALTKQEPKNPAIRLGRAIILNERKQYQPAGEIALDLSKTNHKDPDVWITLAASYAGINDQIKEKECLEKARALEPILFPDKIIPKTPQFAARSARYHRDIPLTPALLDADEAVK